jgi:hypothetical protein
VGGGGEEGKGGCVGLGEGGPGGAEDGDALGEEGDGLGGAGAKDVCESGVRAEGGGGVEGRGCDGVTCEPKDLPVSFGTSAWVGRWW